MIDLGKGRCISSIGVSSIMGHGGDGDWRIKVISPEYRTFCQGVLETKTSIFTKSGTYLPWQGNWHDYNPFTWKKYVRDYKEDSMLNAYGLTNRGAIINALKIRRAMEKGYKVIPNIYHQFFKGVDVAIAEAIATIKLYQKVLGNYFWILENNISCGNSKEKISENMAQVIALARALRAAFPELKFSYKINYDHPYELAEELDQQGLMDVCHSMNSILWERIKTIPDTSPMFGLKGVNGGGSFSGGEIFKPAFDYTKELRKRIKCPIAMAGGISSFGHVTECINEAIDIRTDSLIICTMVRRFTDCAISLVFKGALNPLLLNLSR